MPLAAPIQAISGHIICAWVFGVCTLLGALFRVVDLRLTASEGCCRSDTHGLLFIRASPKPLTSSGGPLVDTYLSLGYRLVSTCSVLLVLMVSC